MTTKSAGSVFYDGDCSICLNFVRRFERILTRHGFKLVPLQTPGVRERLGLSEQELLSEMQLLLPDGKIFGGADAFVEISRRIWWAWPLYLLAQIPGMKFLLRRGYAWIARNRHCLGGVCEIKNAKGNRPSHRMTFFEMP